MNYEHPELIDRLASEYVLGILVGAARRRFEKILLESSSAREAVARWEAKLGALASGLEEVEPPQSVWQSLAARIEPPSDTVRPSAWNYLTFWLGSWAVLATALAIVLWFRFEQEIVPISQERQIAFAHADNAQPLWLVSLNLDTGQLQTQAISATAHDLDKVYELWMLPAQGAPRSLGLMPVDGDVSHRTFSPALIDLLRQAQGLAVSIEPSGGSPTGVPTGPVVYQAELIPL